MIVRPVSAGNFTKIAAVVLTLNEEDFIKDCLRHLRPYVDLLMLVDGVSVDNTVELAYPHCDHIIVRKFSGSFAEERNYAQSRLPPGYNWVLHCDADERFNEEFLRRMKEIIMASNVHCFRFPRINEDKTYMNLLLNPKDHQVRLIDKRYCFWVRSVHEIVWHREANKPADQYSVKELSEYPIIHLKRPKEIRKAILNRWKTLSNLRNTNINQIFI